MSLDFKKPCKHTFSANEIRIASECQRKRYYASRDCLALRVNTPNKHLLLGSIFHDALSYYYTQLDRIVKEFGYNEVDFETCLHLMYSIPYYEITSDDKQPMDSSDTDMFNFMLKKYMPQIAEDVSNYEVIACEQAFHMDHWPVEDVMYHGYIDMVVRKRDDGKIYFFEHKTCKSFRPEIYSRFDVQLHIYAEYGRATYGHEFGGMILNQIKKAKTSKGYDTLRQTYIYDETEYDDFFNWLKAKTLITLDDTSKYTPCNNFMSCKMCEYQSICMKFGYAVPTSREQIIGQKAFQDEEGNEMFVYNPREEDLEDNDKG